MLSQLHFFSWVEFVELRLFGWKSWSKAKQDRAEQSQTCPKGSIIGLWVLSLSLGAQGTNAIDDQGLFVYMEMCAELENNIWMFQISQWTPSGL